VWFDGNVEGSTTRGPVPVNLRLLVDPDTARRSTRDGTPTLLGGSPLRMLRFSAKAGAALDGLLAPAGTTVAQVAADPAVDLTPASVAKLARRLLDAGLVHPRPTPRAPAAGEVTIVVPAHNRANSVARLLDALSTDPEVEGVERIVVDDGSTDETSAVALARHATVLHTEHPSGPGGARMAGLREVTTPFVAFIDSDCVPEPGWLGRLLAHLDDPAVSLVAPRIVSLGSGASTSPPETSPPASESPAGQRSSNTGSILARYEHAHSALDLGARRARVRPRSRVAYVPAAALLMRTSAIVDIGGFDTSMLVGEDVDIVWRLDDAGWTARYEPDARVGHDHRTTWFAFARRRFDYGTSAGPLAKRHKGALPSVAVSAWSAAAWSSAVFGGAAGVGVGLGIAGVSTALLPRKLRALSSPWRYSLKLAGRGHLGAGRMLASAVMRSWLPLAVLAAVPSRRARRALAIAAIVPALDEWRTRRPPLDPARWVAVRALDDAAYCAGVWSGCIRAHTIDPLLPDLTSWPGRSTTGTPGGPRTAPAGWAQRLRRTRPYRSDRSTARP
jgi:mycofactocin glycosyltransferase